MVDRQCCMLQLLETMSGLAIGQMVAERATLVMRMSEIEDWDIVAASHKTGAPVSAMPGRLRAVISAGMEQVQAVLMEAKRAEAVVTNHRFNTLGELHAISDIAGYRKAVSPIAGFARMPARTRLICDARRPCACLKVL